MRIALQTHCSKAVWGRPVQTQGRPDLSLIVAYLFSVQDLRSVAGIIFVLLFEALDELFSQKIAKAKTVVGVSCVLK